MLFDASPWVALACIGALLVVTGADAERRGWAVAAVATLALFLGLRMLPVLVPGERVIGNLWDWTGLLLGLAGVLLIAFTLVRRGLLDWRDAGITLCQAPGSLPLAAGLIVATLGINYVTMSLSPFRLPGVPLETWLYQASVPGLVEETLFRGVLLAMADRAVSPRRAKVEVMGARIGYGGLAVTAAFLALHGLSLGAVMILPAALLYLWLRARTGSLVLPIVAHNLWNLSVYAAHL